MYLTTPTTAAPQRPLAAWLLACCALIAIMVVLGGITRLTGSGLSMVQWQPVYGVLPPLSEQDWLALFTQYQQTPEFKHVNYAMDVAGFKRIFWLEYWHRLLGRVIGLVFLLPFLIFWWRGRIPTGLAPKLAALFILGGLQGALGWYMVKSGLVNNPHVSPYRLSAHLLLAVLVYGLMVWTALTLLMPSNGASAIPRSLRAGLYGVLALIVLTIAAGGFVAGLKAGLTYNTFPLMAGQWLPEGMYTLEPWYRNLFENVTTVQFNHRWLAKLTVLAVVLLWLAARRHTLPRAVRLGFDGLLLVALSQVALGIATLLGQVPLALAAAHQAGALALFTVALYMTYRLSARALTAPDEPRYATVWR